MAVWGEKSCLNARWMNEQMNEWSDKWKGCDGLPSDLGGCSQEILTPKWSECMGGDVKGIFRVAVQAPSVCPNHAYLSTSDNVSAPMEVWTRILPYLNAPATRYETFSLTIEMNHGQWAQLRYGTAFFFFFLSKWPVEISQRDKPRPWGCPLLHHSLGSRCLPEVGMWF